jgi:subtilisin family serine protease
MVRRVKLIVISVILVLPYFGSGQETIKNKKRYFQLPSKATSSDYRSGIINIKVKPEYRNAFTNSHQLKTKASKIFEELGFESLRPVVPENKQQILNARIKRKPKYDLGLYQRIRFSGNIPIEDAINKIYATGMVEFAEPEYIEKIHLIPDDSLLDRQYHLELIKAFNAWDISTGDTTVVIAIVDSGIDVDHPDIKGNLWVNPNDPADGIDNDGNGYIDDINGWDFGGALKEMLDDGDNDPDITKGGGHEHGLGVAGIASAASNNGIGFAGTGYNCRIMVTKHFADDQPEDAVAYASSPYEGIVYAAENGAHVINCSWGSSFRSQFNQDLINYVALDLGALVVASSGNSGLEEAHYPSDYDNVLSVSAVDRSLRKSSFTTYGKGVDITAPGSAIPILEIDASYGVTQGTSFSAPMVAGAAGLVKSVYPEFDGLQVGELLRVTANDTIYEVNSSSSFSNKLGKGILDMGKALTAQPPSIRMMSFRLFNDEGNTPGLGDEAYFVADFKNFLWPSSNGLSVKLSSESGLLQVIDDISDLGIIERGQTITNAAKPFKVRIDENVPTNMKIDLLLEFEDGEYTDYQYISILLNPTFLNIEENLVTSSIAENGRIGYRDSQQFEGLGFIFDSRNNLYEMGLMAGNSDWQLSNSVRSLPGTPDDDFSSTKRISHQSPGDFSAAEIMGQFVDSLAGDSACNILVDYRTMVWKEAPNDKYFIVEYSIKNIGDSILNSFYTGLYADWDIGDDGRADRADWDAGTSMGYVYNTDTSDQVYTGIQILTGSPNYWAIDNDETITGNPWGVYDEFKDEEKYESMSSGIGRQQAGFGDADGDDVSHTVAAGPFAIDPGDSIVIAFAIHGASSFEDLIASAQAADTVYNRTIKEPAPVLTDTDICYEDSAVLTASGATAYKWYKSKTGGEAFFEGEEYTTVNLLNDTTFYVSNAENTWESVRTPVNVNVKANPSIILSGSLFLCNGDTTTLMVEEADTYLWSPGNETTQHIEVTETGDYNITVTYAALGCVSTSEVISIVKNESPSAAFLLDKNEIKKDEDIVINMTDQSVNTSGWFWKLSDGQTSTEQNPNFTVNTQIPIDVTLTATSPEGCQDKDIQTIDVITGLDEETRLAKSLKFYPNPTTGELNIELSNEYTGNFSVIIYNSTGKVVKAFHYSKRGEYALEIIDLNGLSKGLYLLQINQEPLGQSTSRIILR